MHRSSKRLRVALYVVAGLCAICVVGVLAPGPSLERWMALHYGVGEDDVTPMCLYCLRIGCAVSAVAGAYFLTIAKRPRHYDRFVRLGIVGLVSAGLVALVAGSQAEFARPGHVIDGVILCGLGLLLLVWSRGRKWRRRRYGYYSREDEEALSEEAPPDEPDEEAEE